MGEKTIFLKKVYKAMADFEHVNDSCEIAVVKVVKKLTNDLNHLVDIYENFKFDATAGTIHSLKDKQLETRNQDFLLRLKQYVQGVDAAFKSRSDNLARVSIQKYGIHRVKDNEQEVQKILQDAEESILASFEKAIKRTNKYAHRRMEEAKQKNITHLKNYDYEFSQLALFENLTMIEVINLLVTKGSLT